MGNKIQNFINALTKNSDGRFCYVGENTGTQVGCSDFVRLNLYEAGIITLAEKNDSSSLWAINNYKKVLIDKARFQCLPASTQMQDGDILFYAYHHVAVYYNGGIYEAAPKASHYLATNGKSAVGYFKNFHNCSGGSLTNIYRIIDTDLSKVTTTVNTTTIPANTQSTLATSAYPTGKHWDERKASDIKYIIPHHMAAKNTGSGCSYYFKTNGLENSVNYCIGYDGDISLSVYENYGSWTSSFSKADCYGITMEVSDTATPTNWTTLAGADWHIPSKAQEAMIQLCVDIIKRYPSLGGKMVYDPSDASKVAYAKKTGTAIPQLKGNVLLHEWTSNYGTSCPEWHMKEILPAICAEVNKRLDGGGGTTVYTKHELAQQCIDGKWGNGNTRVTKLTEYITKNKLTFTAKDVQAEIDLMLAKQGLSIESKELLTALLNANLLPTIKSGVVNEIVKVLQNWLNKAGYYSGSIDGSCGPMMTASIKALQSNWSKVYGNFTIDGSFGPACWKKMLGL